MTQINLKKGNEVFTIAINIENQKERETLREYIKEGFQVESIY